MKTRHILTLSAAAAVLSVAGLTGCQKSKTDEARTGAPVIDVASVVVDTVTLHKDYPGYLQADNEVKLVARVNGYLLAKPYKKGSFVKKGAVLFTIESRNYEDQVRQARSSLENARAAYAYASSNYAAMKKALESDAVSQMEVLQSKSAMEEAQANIASSEAALKTAQTQLGYCTVRAPFDGHVSSSPFDVGAYLAGAGSPVELATIYDDAMVAAVFSIDDKQLAAITANQNNPQLKVDMTKIPIHFENELQHTYTGNLEYTSPAIDRSTGTLQMQAYIDNPDNELRSGMYCTISLPNAIVPNAILVKDASIGTDQLGKYVYVVNDSDKVVYTHIEVSELVADTMRVVTKGLRPGDRYVTKALLKVRDGETVKPREVK